MASGVTSLQLGQLVELVPTALSWLRDAVPGKAGDLFVEAAGERDDLQVRSVLLQLAEEQNRDGDLTMLQLRHIFAQASPRAVAGSVRAIVVDCEPQFVSPHVARMLHNSMDDISRCSSGHERAGVLGNILDALPRRNYYALAELCAVFRDTRAPVHEVAALVGPGLLIPSEGPRNRGSTVSSSSASLFAVLIEECDVIFGRAPTSFGSDALGFRKGDLKELAQNNEAATLQRRRGHRKTVLMQRSRRRQALKGPVTESTADGPGDDDSDSEDDSSDDGLDMSQAPARESRASRMAGSRRAGGTRRSTAATAKAAAAAAAAAEEQSDARQRENEDEVQTSRMQDLVTFFNWRDPSKAAAVSLLFENYKFPAIAHAIHERYMGAIPPPWKAELAAMVANGEPGLEWYERKMGPKRSGRVPSVRGERRFSMLGPGLRVSSTVTDTRTPLDRAVDELIDTEHYFHDCLQATSEFWKQIRAIARGAHGANARQRLGLNKEDIEIIFGYRINDMMQLSRQFLSNLEVIDVVRSKPLHRSRAGLAAEALSGVLEEIGVMFGRYAAGHEDANALLARASAASMKRHKSGRHGPRRGSFEDMWKQFTRADKRLRNSKLQAVLIMPVQRVPRYELLFREIHKAMAPDDSDRPVVEAVKEQIGVVAVEINEAIRAGLAYNDGT